jgi:hypothetical protein
MRHRLGRLLVGTGAIALMALGVPALTAAGTASATSPGAHHPSTASSATPSAEQFTLTTSGATTMSFGTSHWMGTEGAGPTGAQAPTAAGGTHHLLPAAKVSAHVPDVGVTDRNTTIPAAHGSPRARNAGREGATTGPSARSVSVTGRTPGLVSIAGSDAYDQGVLHPAYKTGMPQPLPGVDVEPPDQGLCAGNGYVMEVNNMVVQLFTSATMTPLSTHGMALEKLFNAPEVFGGAGTGTDSVQGDPRCYYTPTTHRWFASQLWLTELDATAARQWAGEFVAVSTSTAPNGTWDVYFIPDLYNAKGVDGCNDTPPATKAPTTFTLGAANPCFGDQPLLGVNSNAVFISVNEYGLYRTDTPGGVATEYVLSKTDLLDGTTSPIVWGTLGQTVPRPGASPTCPFGSPAAVHCPFYSIVPAVSDGSYVTATTGTFYAMSAVTFTTSGGHQVALWQFTHTGAVATGGPISGSVTFATTVSYTEPPTSLVNGTVRLRESLATQKMGPHPLGTTWETITGTAPIKWPGREGKIATNTDRITTAAYDPATGAVWGALNTGAMVAGGAQAAIAWFRVTPTGSGTTLHSTTVASGVLAVTKTSDFFPSITFTNTGKGVMDYVLSGKAYYPSTGYSFVGATGPTPAVHVARMGVGPADGFSEYTPTYDRPRWGDYSTALATGTTFFFAAEMVNQSCTVSQFKATFTCGGTRDRTANWGTSVNKLTA